MFKKLLHAFQPASPPHDATARAADARERGNATLGQGRLDAAASCYREALQADPDDALAHVNLAYVFLEQQQAAAAAELLQRATGLRSKDDAHLQDAWFLLGRARQELGDGAAAIEAFGAALRVQPAFGEALHALVPLLLAAGRPAEALQRAQQLVALQPSAAARVLLARAHYALADDAAVLATLEPVLREEPGNADALAGYGHALLRRTDYEGAAQAFRTALQAHGPSVERLVDLASACHRLGQREEAADLVRQALALAPGHPAALSLQVVVLTEELRLPEAEAIAREALRAHPTDADLHWNLSIALLMQGKLKEGWAEHRWRWQAGVMATSRPSARPEPAWHGESLAGRSILLASEQGFGDMIHFLRYVPQVAAVAGRVLVQAPGPLHALLADLPANCQVVQPSDSVRGDVQCALLDLPDVLVTTLENIPAPVPYLHADPTRVAHWRARVRDGSDRPHVGLAWSGNPAHTNDRRRSIPLALLASVLQADCRFVSVQTQVRASDETALRSLPLLSEAARELGDFADTAALLQALDLVITVDTSVAHLAGALGRPVWVLLPYAPDWRWMLEREDSPWYPTARLFRQQRPGDWPAVLARVEHELQRLSVVPVVRRDL
jgi:tetratricopeptide (TPR) repeat protein